MATPDVQSAVRAALDEPPTAPDEQPARFKLLASAIAGRVVEVAAGEPGDVAWTDGATVFIPRDADAVAVLRSVVVQAALLGSGSLDPVILSSIRRGAHLRRYLSVEGHRVLLEHEALLPPAVRSIVDRSVGAMSGSPSASVKVAGRRDPIPEPPEVFGAIRPRRMRTGTELGEGPAVAGRHIPAKGDEERELRELDEEAGAGDTVADVLSSPIGGSGAVGRLLKRMFGDARSSGSGPPGSDSATHRSRRGTSGARRVGTSTVTAAVPDRVDDPERVGVTYPEWDVHRGRYRPDWCTVAEVDPDGLAPLVPPDTHAFRRPLARLGMDLERCRRQPQGDDIDIDAVVEARVQARTGGGLPDGLYVDTLRRRRDLSVLLLVDISGSAGEPSAAGGTVHEQQRAAAAALMVALHDLGDRVAVYGFRSHGRRDVQVIPAKRFGAPVDATVMHRLGGFVPGGYTRLGAAIRHGGAVLERESGTPRRLLVVLSDGFAYDHGYEGSYGEADARRALAECRRRGTGCLCLTVGAGTDVVALRRIFGTAAHATIPRPELLPGIIGPLFRSALRSSEAQRRVSQRRERSHERLSLERRSA